METWRTTPHATTTELEVEGELGRERAEALGRAGRALADAVARYRAAEASEDLSAEDADRILDEVAVGLY